jgi:hypothetical protein
MLQAKAQEMLLESLEMRRLIYDKGETKGDVRYDCATRTLNYCPPSTSKYAVMPRVFRLLPLFTI